MGLAHLQTLGRRVVSFQRRRRRYDVLVDADNCVWEYEVDGERRAMAMPVEEASLIALRLSLPGVDKPLKDEWARADEADRMFQMPEAP